MSLTSPMSSRQEHGRFDRARALERSHDKIQHSRAAHVVAGHSVDEQDCARLLAMLGLDAPAGGDHELT